MNGLLQRVVQLYNLVLRLYPRSHRDQYAREMRAVFALAVEAASRDGALAVTRCCMRELRDLPAALCEAHRRARRMVKMSRENKSSPFLAAGSWGQALGAAVPFVLVGLFATWNALPVALDSGWLHSLLVLLLVAGYLGALTGLVVGWVKGFPRWSYGYVLCLPLWSWVLGGIKVSDQVYLERWSLIPLGVAVVIALVHSRSFRPLLRLVAGVWEDWTQLSFVLYSLATFMLWASFDEVRNEHELPFAIVMNLILIAGALVYIRVPGRWRRALALADGLGLAWIVMIIGTATYWHGRTVGLGTEPINAFAGGGMTVALMAMAEGLLLAPALLSLLRRLVRSGRFSLSA